MGNECVFCGEKAGSREHVFPKWLRKEAPKDFVDADGSRGIVSDGKLVTVPERFATAQVKCVCGTCNNGWMSRLESGVKPFLLDLMRGDPLTLGRQEQTLLATWPLKTVMMLQKASNRDYPDQIPQVDHAHLYRHGKLSMRRMVARAFHVIPPGDDHSHTWGDLEVRDIRGRHHGYLAKIRTGAFAVQIVSAKLPPHHEIARFGLMATAIPLWPARERFDWPAPAPLPHEQWTRLSLQRLPYKKRSA
ncbi:hypothetical protein [Streptomyces olivaceiscleroticus]|uniref:HNH endonuclease n=1 Tax=Streptomyces olivaceiscleroticus TaxID=68245 RepID=A0ABP3JJ68_9ACTN